MALLAVSLCCGACNYSTSKFTLPGGGGDGTESPEAPSDISGSTGGGSTGGSAKAPAGGEEGNRWDEMKWDQGHWSE